jgi:hypothetical protein
VLREPRLPEEIRERSVVEQIFRLDDFSLPEFRRRGDLPAIGLRIGWPLVGRRGTLPTPA